MPLDLATVKQHLRVSDNDDDALIGLYWLAAQDSAEQFLNRTVYADQTALDNALLLDETDNGVVTNASIEAAVLLVTGHLYASREDVAVGVSVAQLPSGSERLLMPYRVGMGV